MRCSPRTAGLAACLTLLLASDTGRADFNPLEWFASVVETVSGVARGAGQVVGAPVGGIVEAATTPVIRNVEDSVQDVLADLDERLGKQMAGAGKLGSELLAEANKDVTDRVNQVDQKVAHRILQAQWAADELVDRTLGEIDVISQKRLAEAIGGAKSILTQLDKAVASNIQNLDRLLQGRLDQVGTLVTTSISKVDDVIKARLEQLDSMVAVRLGNVDVIAARQALNLEAILLRMGSLVALLVFVSFVLWRLWNRFGIALEEARKQQTMSRKALKWAQHTAGILTLEIAAGVAGAAVLFVLADKLPVGARTEAEKLADVHELGLRKSVESMDESRAAYHAAQLRLLDPADARHTLTLEAKSRLLRSVFQRPALLQSPEGVSELMRQLADYELILHGTPDADLMVLKAHVLWQVGSRRQQEAQAATLCAEALRTVRDPKPGDFVLQPLARHYLGIYVDTASEKDDAAAMLRATYEAAPARQFPGLEHAFAYDRLLATLERESSNAYVAMLEAHANYVVARTKKQANASDEKAKRTRLAQEVIAAWRKFDDGLQSNAWLAGSPAVLAAFEVNDAVLTHALWFQAFPDEEETLPAMESLTMAQRARLAPIRIAWARRYGGRMGPHLQALLSVQEAQRYQGHETRTRAFEDAVVALLVARGTGKPVDGLAQKAALAAASVGMKVGEQGKRSRYTDVIAPSTGAETLAAYALRHWRYL